MHAPRVAVPGGKNCAEGPDEKVSGPQPNSLVSLEVESQLTRKRPRRHVMRAAERGQEVVQRYLVGQVDDREACAPPVFVIMKEVVISDGRIEQVARSDARRVFIVIFCPGRRNFCER
jgi:hypothetical protein